MVGSLQKFSNERSRKSHYCHPPTLTAQELHLCRGLLQVSIAPGRMRTRARRAKVAKSAIIRWLTNLQLTRLRQWSKSHPSRLALVLLDLTAGKWASRKRLQLCVQIRQAQLSIARRIWNNSSLLWARSTSPTIMQLSMVGRGKLTMVLPVSHIMGVFTRSRPTVQQHQRQVIVITSWCRTSSPSKLILHNRKSSSLCAVSVLRNNHRLIRVATRIFSVNTSN